MFNAPCIHCDRLNIVFRFGIGWLILMVGVAWWVMAQGSWGPFVDLGAMVWCLVIVCGGLWLSFGPMRIARALAAGIGLRSHDDEAMVEGHARVLSRAYQLAWVSGLIGVLIGMMAMLEHMADPSAIGSAVSSGLAPLLYGALLAEFVIAPMQAGLAGRVAGDECARSHSMLPIAFAVVFCVLVVYLIAVLPWIRWPVGR